MQVLIQNEQSRVYIEDDGRGGVLVCEDAEDRHWFEPHEIRAFWMAQNNNREPILHIQDHGMRAYRYGPVDPVDVEMVAARMAAYWAQGNVSRNPDAVDLKYREPRILIRNYIEHGAAYLSDAAMEIRSMSGDVSDPRAVEIRQMVERVRSFIGVI